MNKLTKAILLIIIVLALQLPAFAAVDASTTINVSPAGAIRPVQKTRWVVNVSDNDASTFEIIQAAPGATANLYLEYIIINCAASDTVTILDGTSTTMLGPFTFVSTGTRFVTLDFRPDSLQLTANKSLSFTTGQNTSAVTIVAKGFTK